MNNIQFHERYDDNCHGIVWITYTRRIMSKVWQISFFQSFVFRVLRMPLPETTLETLVRYLWTHLWVPFCPVVPTRFHRAFGRGVLWASSDSSWVCWAWLSYYILHLKPLGGSWVGKRFLKRTCKKKPCHFLWFWYLYLSQVLSWICLPKPMARSTEESTDRSSPIPRIHQRQSLDPWRSFLSCRQMNFWTIQRQALGPEWFRKIREITNDPLVCLEGPTESRATLSLAAWHSMCNV